MPARAVYIYTYIHSVSLLPPPPPTTWEPTNTNTNTNTSPLYMAPDPNIKHPAREVRQVFSRLSTERCLKPYFDLWICWGPGE